MNSLYHTHAWLSVTSAASGALRAAGPISLLNLSDNASLGGPQGVSFSIAGRTVDGVPWRELMAVGDLVRVGAHYHEDGQTITATLIEDAVVSDVQVQESMQQGQYSLTTHVSCESLQSAVLSTDTVAWWMYYGTVEGALRAKAALMPDDVSGQLDKVVANYLNKVAFHVSNWQRDGVAIRERIGYHLRTLKPNVPPLLNLTVAEGSHWEIISGQAELGLHELFVQQRREGDPARPFVGGYVHHAKHQAPALTSTADPGPNDGSRPYIILRPKPFPYADRNGKPVMSEWNALPMHDFTNSRATTGHHAFGHSMAGVKNFVMVFPGYDSMNEQVALTNSIAVMNAGSIARYGYRPVKVGTNLILNEGSEADMLGLARELTWRMAAQMNRTDEMANGSITVPLAPAVQPGDRAKFRLIHADGTDAGVFQGYVTGRTHTYQQGGGGTTSLSLERVLPDATYRDPSWFVAGLKAAGIEWPTPTHAPA